MRHIDFSFQPSVFVCGAPCHASYLRIGKIGLFGGLPLGRDSHHPQSHCPHHLFSRCREQERPRSSLPPLLNSTLEYHISNSSPYSNGQFKSSSRITSDPGHRVSVFSFAWKEDVSRPRVDRGVCNGGGNGLVDLRFTSRQNGADARG